MSKKAVIILVILLLLGGSVAFVLLNNHEASAPETTTSTSQAQNTANEPNSTEQSENTPSAGEYTAYSAAALANTDGTKLLFFHAPWCPQCLAIEQDIEVQGVPAGVTVFKVDYDSNQSLRQQYGVTLQTTFVKVDDEGKLVKKYVAYDEPTFNAVKENML